MFSGGFVLSLKVIAYQMQTLDNDCPIVNIKELRRHNTVKRLTEFSKEE